MKELKCPDCGYNWEYKGTLDYATCPNCMRKVKVTDNGVKNENMQES